MLSLAGGGGGPGVEPFFVTATCVRPLSLVAGLILMYEKLVITCGLPSCRIWKSSAFRPLTGLPWLSVTLASTCTRLTLMRITVSGGAGGWVWANAIASDRINAMARSIRGKEYLPLV